MLCCVTRPNRLKQSNEKIIVGTDPRPLLLLLLSFRVVLNMASRCFCFSSAFRFASAFSSFFLCLSFWSKPKQQEMRPQDAELQAVRGFQVAKSSCNFAPPPKAISRNVAVCLGVLCYDRCCAESCEGSHTCLILNN